MNARPMNVAFGTLLAIGVGSPALAQTPVTTYSYDPNGNLTTVAAPLGRTTTNAYDALNRVLSVTDPMSGVSGYGYNRNDRLTSVTDPRGLVTSYTVDGLGNVTQQTSPDTGTTAMSYDAAGNVLTRTDARGKTGTYTYDALNRVTAISYATNSPSNASFSYDAGTNGLGRLTGMTDVSGGTSWGYDQHGRVIRKTLAFAPTIPGSNETGLVVAYGYDVQGRMSSITYPSGKIVTYGYDGAGRVSQVSVDGYALAFNITYQPFGAPKSWAWGDGSTMTRSFDTDGRMTSHTVGGATRSVTYDPASRIIQISEGTPTSISDYDYDSLDRLTNYRPYATVQAYAYDANGNRTQVIIGAMTYAYTNSATSNRLTATAGPAPARSYNYDAAGNMVGDASADYRFDYDERGRLSLAKISATSGGTYRVNGLGQRAVKSGGSGRLFIYDEIGRLLGEYYPNGNAVREYVYLGPIAIGVLTNNAYVLDNAGTGVTVVGTWPTVSNDPNDPAAYGATYRSHAAGSGGESFTWTPALSVGALYRVYARWAAGADRATNATYQVTHLFGSTDAAVNQRQQGGQWVLLGTFSLMPGEGHNVRLTDNANGLVVADAVKFVPADASTVYSIHTDHLDTPRVVKRSAGPIVWRWDSDPFGATPANQDADGNGILFEFPLRFRGQYFDKETNLHYNYFRDCYDPAIGRYCQSDPIGLAGGINSYLYVADPLTQVDPEGLTGRAPGKGPYAPGTGPGASPVQIVQNVIAMIYPITNNSPTSSCGCPSSSQITPGQAIGGSMLGGAGVGAGAGLAIGLAITGAQAGKAVGFLGTAGALAVAGKTTFTGLVVGGAAGAAFGLTVAGVIVATAPSPNSCSAQCSCLAQ